MPNFPEVEFFGCDDTERQMRVSGWWHAQKFGPNGESLTTWGELGVGDGEFYYPQGVATDSSGNVYVADSDNERIQKFDSEGNFATKWGTYGYNTNGKFDGPKRIATDSTNNVYVLDYNSIQKFDSAGNFLARWRIYGDDLAIDTSGNFYVSDSHYILMNWGHDPLK